MAKLKATVRSLRLFSIQNKLILPYAFLTILLAMIGTFIITRLVVASEIERFHNAMVDSSRVANDGLVMQEKTQLDKLRPVVFSLGMSEAIAEKNADAIIEIMKPFLISSRIDLLTAVDTRGTEIITYGKLPGTYVPTYYSSHGTDFSKVEAIQKVLAGISDAQGDKYVEFLQLEKGPAFFTIAPVKGANNKIVGAMMVGTYLKDVLTLLKAQSLSEVIVFNLNGEKIDTTLTGDEAGFDKLLESVKTINQQETRFQPVDMNLYERPHQVGYSPLIIRSQKVGWIAVIKSREYLVNDSLNSRNLFIVLFTIGTIAVIVIGYLLAQNIARPILKLRMLSQAVAAGDLNQHIGLRRSDEIGDLSEAFDTMTLHLRERTDEAARLYAETLQRNRELAEINARLEAAQLALIQSEKLAAIGQLTAGIVHDVKNPFAVIMGMAEVLGDDEQLDESTRHGLKVIRESAVKGNNIVSDLLKFARQSKPEMRYMDLRETVQTAIRLTAYLTRKYEQAFELPNTPVMLTYDAQQIEQVLINLIHNAVQAMPRKGVLSIRLQQVDSTAYIAVQDTGCGIEPEHLKRIFDPFFTTKPEGEGTGLGLSVSYGIIANHHGKIDVDSVVGEGTTFTIVLPVQQPFLEEESPVT